MNMTPGYFLSKTELKGLQNNLHWKENNNNKKVKLTLLKYISKTSENKQKQNVSYMYIRSRKMLEIAFLGLYISDPLRNCGFAAQYPAY